MRGKVGTWVNSQWKYQATPGQFSVAINMYEKGKRRDDGRAVEIPLTVSLSCAALYHKLEPWEDSAAGKAAAKAAKAKFNDSLEVAFKKVIKNVTIPE